MGILIFTISVNVTFIFIYIAFVKRFQKFLDILGSFLSRKYFREDFITSIMKENVYPYLITAFAHVPVLSSLFEGPAYGIGTLTSSLILAIMVLPFITSVSRDVFDTVPPVLKEAAYGQGFTTWEVVNNIVIPYTRVGLLGGVMLALGRALGETMAVTFVIGNADKLSTSLLAPGTTISAKIANEFTEAVGDLYTSSLIALGLILFVITFIVLSLARTMLARIEMKAGV